VSEPIDEATAGPMVRCDRCGEETPSLDYCVRCGNRLDAPAPRRGVRREYAAAPDEGVAGLHIVSTIFPQLPRADMDSFRVGLAIAVVLMVALAGLGLFPAALAAAAVAVPLLTAIYLHDVDVYEDEPLRVVAFTMAWGAVFGVLSTLVLRAIQPGSTTLSGGYGSGYLLMFGVGVPLIEFAIMLIGPLALLRYAKFNDVLDGATFGVSSAVSFLGARALLVALDFTRAGSAPPGETLPRIVVLLSLGIVLPLLAAGVAGSALGSIWLRTRSSLRSRRPLGMLGNPIVAVAAAGALYVAATLAMLLLPELAALVAMAILGAVAVTWLRLVIHLGLLDEADEVAIGPPVRCANCGRMTPRHTFCGHCGVALRALPKDGRAGRPAHGEEAVDGAG
jgi:hypothetical protein